MPPGQREGTIIHRTRDGRVFRARQEGRGGRTALRRLDASLSEPNGTTSTWAQEVRQLKDACFERGRSIRSAPVVSSHWSYWLSFCEGWGITCEEFGLLRDNQSERDAVLKELDTLSAFAVFIVFFPRVKGRSKGTNSVDYALGVISSVRSHYAAQQGRAPGRSQVAGSDYCFKRVISGLRKIAPHTKNRKVPLLQHHLRALKRQLDLEGSQRDRVFWALWLTQWQGVLRSADLIKPRREGQNLWDPAQETHSARVT